MRTQRFALLASLAPVALLIGLSISLSTASLRAQQKSGSKTKLPTFGPPKGGSSLPGFGRFADGMPAVIEQDRVYAKNQIQKFDTDKDGQLNREEIRRTGYKGIESVWFAFDLDSNQKMSESELANSYAKIRVDKERKTRSQAIAKQKASNISVTSQDKSNASAMLSKLDSNRDRKLSKSELAAAWGGNASKMLRDYDLNRSTYLGSTELSRFYAAERIKQETQQKLMQARYGDMVFLSGRRRSAPQKVSTIAAGQTMGRFDSNGNGYLDQSEWSNVGGNIDTADTDGNGLISHAELAAWLDRLSKRPSAPNPTSTNSSWFGQRDTDGDGQITIKEFAAKWTDSLWTEFQEYDQNRDGVITLAESKSRRSTDGQRFRSKQAAVIETGVGAGSNIHVYSDMLIGDIDVEVSLAHRTVAHLDAILIGPDGRQIVLFRGEGKKWSGGNLSETRFDDEAETPIAKAKPPFKGRFRPDGADSPEKQGLSSYYGKRSNGVWRLLIRADRSVQAGLLHGWSLVISPPGTRRVSTTPAAAANPTKNAANANKVQTKIITDLRELELEYVPLPDVKPSSELLKILNNRIER